MRSPRAHRALTTVAAALLASVGAAIASPERSDAEPARGPAARVEAPVAGCRATAAGPQNVLRRRGKPRFEEVAFATPDPAAAHYLRIDNGGVSRELRPVTSAVVLLNGLRILGPADFQENPYARGKRARAVRTIERAIGVNTQNLLHFKLGGKLGSGFAFEVFAIDEGPPMLLEIAPPDGATVSEPEVTLSLRVADLLSNVASVTCAGLEANAVAEDFACTVPLLPGANAIEVVATDGCGNASVSDVAITFDPPPVVSIDSPTDGEVLVGGVIVDVSGTVDDSAALVTVNGVTAIGAPSFAATVPVTKGVNILTATARDAAGGEGSDSIEVTVVSGGPAPTLKITSPKPGFVVGGPNGATDVDVKGTVDVASCCSQAPSVTVESSAATVTLRSKRPPDWDFNATVAIQRATAANASVLRAEAIDAFGETDVDSVTGTVDMCIDGGSTGNALTGGAGGQSNRCHSIDGCSTPDFVADDVQDPTEGKLGKKSTAFGRDTRATEKIPFGQPPKDKLPCNLHDVCYQTCGSDKIACDDEMLDDMNAVCLAAYPEANTNCPFSPDLVKCTQWRNEKAKCYRWARTYRAGLRTPQATTRYDDRQAEHCLQP
jgi:hypothetical protein